MSSILSYNLTGDLPGKNTFCKTEITRNHPHQNVLVTCYKQQTSHPQTNLDLRNTTLVYGFHFQHRHSRMFPIESLVHDNGRTLVCVEYGYPKGSPNTNSQRRILPLQLSIHCSPQCTSKWPNSKPHWATWQNAIGNIPAKLSAYQIPSVNVVFVILVFKV
jgi:hypothetical protein